MNAQNVGVSTFKLSEPDVRRVLEGFAVREQIIGFLCNAPRNDAIGACLAFLLHTAEKDPGQLRAVLNTPVDRPDGMRRRMVDVITQISK